MLEMLRYKLCVTCRAVNDYYGSGFEEFGNHIQY